MVNGYLKCVFCGYYKQYNNLTEAKTFNKDLKHHGSFCNHQKNIDLSRNIIREIITKICKD